MRAHHGTIREHRTGTAAFVPQVRACRSLVRNHIDGCLLNSKLAASTDQAGGDGRQQSRLARRTVSDMATVLTWTCLA